MLDFVFANFEKLVKHVYYSVEEQLLHDFILAARREVRQRADQRFFEDSV